ncbi:MAG TPA: methyltransferase domain-containing protein [Thermoplasmata archaeon]|nr:methyltransferase domain-containing protein [Thermoplasmata archaeon]
MPWKYTEEYYREYTRTTWNESAEVYQALLRNLEPFRSDLSDRLLARPGERILDLGTGPGEPALTLAGRVGPTGKVVGVDLSEEMVAIARRAATARSVSNAEFRVMDCSSLALEDGGFDGAISCFGFQIFTDPERAARETYRVLGPKGRIAVSVWSSGDRVPWIHAIIGPMLKHAEPDETGYIPTPYELGGPGEMVRFLEAAGFVGAREERVSHPLTFRNEEEYLRSILKGTPIGHSLSEEPPEVQEQVLRETHANLAPWTSDRGITLPSECVLVTASK